MGNIKESQMSFADYENGKRKIKNDFLEKVTKIVNWLIIETILNKDYKQIQNAIGSLAYPPIKMFKILLLQRFYELSDPAMEENLYDRISFQQFTGFSVSEDIPDHSTICRFRNRLIETNTYEKVFYEFNRQIESLGLMVKTGTMVDATVIESSRRPRKKKEEVVIDRDEDDHPQIEETAVYSDDAEAKFLKKGDKLYYGYKAHVGVDGKEGFIRGGHVTSANKSDSGQLEEVIMECGVVEDERIGADKGYDGKANREVLKNHGLKDGIQRKKKKNKEETHWNKLRNRMIASVRYIVERTFGSLKRQYKLNRFRYVGIEKAQMEFLLVSMCYNIKKAVILTT